MSEHISSELSAFLDGRLSGAAARKAEAHLGACALCQQETNDLRMLKSSLTALPRHAAPPTLMRSLNHAFLDAPRPRERRWALLPVSLLWRPAGAFAALAIAAAGLLAVHISSRDNTMDLQPLITAHMRYQAESLVPSADPAHCNLSAQLVNYNAQED